MIGAAILGIVAGYLGRLLMPGKDKMGFIATTLLGLAGAAVGWLLFHYVLGIGDADAFDLGSLAGAVVGVIVLLGLYRLYRHHESGHDFHLGRRGHGLHT
jgi:uncharacterized membrane protein YeaQ/YmgE (transglycosylase-associated protein family)